MHWLFIDTSRLGQYRLGLLKEGGKGIETIAGRSSALLPSLAKKIGLAKLKKAVGICAVSGPGSFTSVRTGVLVANLLARLLNKPLVGVTVAEADDPAQLFERLRKQDIVQRDFVAPIYDAEPNITLASKT